MSESGQEPVSQESVEAGHEPETLRIGAVALVGVGLLGLVLVAMAMMYGLGNYFAAQRDRVSPEERRAPEPPVGVEPHQALTRMQLQEQEMRQLNSYGWIDRERGVARIPVERAMQLMAERGLPYEDREERDDTASENGDR